MNSLRLSVINTLVRQDIYYALRSTRGLLFLVFFSIFWLWVLWKLSSGNAQYLANPEASFVLSIFIDSKVAQSLFIDRSPTFSAFFYLAISTVPMFVLFAASDQTANDIGSKYLRFLTPRCNRLEIYVARFFGAVVLIAVSYLSVSLIAALISIMVDKSGMMLVLRDLPLVVFSLILYAIPFIAFMSLCSVIVGSAGLSALLGFSFYTILLVIIAVVGIKMSGVADVLDYALPNASKTTILQLSWSGLLTAAISVPVYVCIYGYLGWIMFSKRDI